MIAESENPKAIDRPLGKPWRIPEAAEFIGISERSMRRHITDGRIPSLRIVGLILISDEVVRRLATEGL